MTRTIGIVLGIVAVLLGGLFTLQGVGLVGGSFMTGDRLWVLIGVVLVVVGLGLVYNVLRRPTRPGRGRR